MSELIESAFPEGLVQCEVDPDETCHHCKEPFRTHFAVEDKGSGYVYHEFCLVGHAEDIAEAYWTARYEG